MKLLHQNASPETLKFVRVWVFGIWFLIIAQDPIHLLSFLPISVFEPVGFLRIIPMSLRPLLINSLFLYGLKIVTLISLVLVILNIFSKPAGVFACIFLTVYRGVVRGFGGHISHDDLVLLYAAYFLALFPLADAMVQEGKWAGFSPSRSLKDGSIVETANHMTVNLNGIPLIAILSTMCFTYTLVGVYRIVHGGIETFTSGSITFWALRNSFQVLHPTLGFGKFLLDYPLFDKMLNFGFAFITLFEVFAPLCLFSRWFRYAFLAVMIPFHFLSWIIMEVFFWENLALYIIFFDLKRNGKDVAS